MVDGKNHGRQCSRISTKAADTEKITINLGYVDLSHVDLMVQEGFYSLSHEVVYERLRLEARFSHR
jgi:hypothetical protein